MLVLTFHSVLEQCSDLFISYTYTLYGLPCYSLLDKLRVYSRWRQLSPVALLTIRRSGL